MGNHSQSHKEVQEHNTSAIIAEFKVTLDPIVISWRHWRIQEIKGQKDQEMTEGIGLFEQSRGRDGDSEVMDVMKMINAFITCLANFNRRFEGHNIRTQSYRDITPNARDV